MDFIIQAFYFGTLVRLILVLLFEGFYLLLPEQRQTLVFVLDRRISPFEAFLEALISLHLELYILFKLRNLGL